MLKKTFLGTMLHLKRIVILCNAKLRWPPMPRLQRAVAMNSRSTSSTIKWVM